MDEAVLATSWVLTLRSFVEIIIVGQLDRRPKDLRNMWRAKDVCFHLGSALAFILASGLVWEEKGKKYNDPLHDQETIDINLVTSCLRDTIQQYAENNPEATFPPFEEVLKVVELQHGADTKKHFRKGVFNLSALPCDIDCIAADFSINGTFKEYTALNDGHINSTYVISFDDKGDTVKYTLQKITKSVAAFFENMLTFSNPTLTQRSSSPLRLPWPLPPSAWPPSKCWSRSFRRWKPWVQLASSPRIRPVL